MVLQQVEGGVARGAECHDLAVDIGFILAVGASAFTMAGYRTLKSLSFRARKCTLPPLLMARALDPSNFNSYWKSALSGSFSVRRRSIGSTNLATPGTEPQDSATREVASNAPRRVSPHGC